MNSHTHVRTHSTMYIIMFCLGLDKNFLAELLFLALEA